MTLHTNNEQPRSREVRKVPPALAFLIIFFSKACAKTHISFWPFVKPLTAVAPLPDWWPHPQSGISSALRDRPVLVRVKTFGGSNKEVKTSVVAVRNRATGLNK